MPNDPPTTDAWAAAIGYFMLNFGMVEYHTFVFLEGKLTAEEFSRVKKWHLQDRLGWIGKYLKDQNFPETDQDSFAHLTGRIAPVRDLRNLIAHGYLYGRYDPGTRSFAVVLSPAKDLDVAHLPESRSVEFAEICSALNTLQELLEPLSRLAGFEPDPDPFGILI